MSPPAPGGRRRAPALLLLLGAACGGGGSRGDRGPALSAEAMQALAAHAPATLPAPPPDPSNRYADDPRAARLGQALFFDPGFSGPLLDPDNDGGPGTLGRQGEAGRVACASCHVPRAGFLDARSDGGTISLGAGWGLRKAPSLLDVGQARLLLWDGRHDAFYNQIFTPLESPLEMNGSRLFAAQQVARRYRAEYEALFGPLPPLLDPRAFPQLEAQASGCRQGGVLTPTCAGALHGVPGDRAEYDGLSSADQAAVTRVVVDLGKALGAYQRRLACGPGRFDRWVHGDAAALTPAEQRGAALFVGKARCAGCHAGPFFTDQGFHNVGVAPRQVHFSPADRGDRGAIAGLAAALADPLNVKGAFSDGDDGRLPAAVTPAMETAFKTPSLRCVALRPSFLHTGQLRSLAQVVAFFDRGGDTPEAGTSELQPLGLDAAEQADLVSFLGALTGPGPAEDLLAPP